MTKPLIIQKKQVYEGRILTYRLLKAEPLY